MKGQIFLLYVFKMAGCCLLAQSGMYRHVQLSFSKRLDGKLIKKNTFPSIPAQIDTHGQVSVAAVGVEPITPEGELHQRHMRRVHALQRDARGADIPTGFGDEVFQSLQNLLED